jgi:preprotein translocase subunit YajC
MTDLILTRLPLTVAMAQAGQGSQSIWVQLFPFAMMLLIFYLLVLMPMRKRQKKVQEFQASLKVGDKVITTGGIYGEVNRIDADTVQLQVAEKMRIVVARASIGGYQGQEPVVQRDGSGGM